MNLFKMNQLNKNIRLLYFLVAILSSGMTNLLAQETQGDPYQANISQKYFPLSPSERAFEKFVNIPQGNYSGVHGFSVPIYNIQGKDFNFPISIDYHGGGVKVDEIAGSVGLGWNLTLGGINFSQEVRGLLDTATPSINVSDPVTFEPNGNTNDYLKAMSMIGTIGAIALDCVLLNDGTPPNGEVNPDYYSYSLLNNSGKYIKDSDGIRHTIPKDDVVFINDQKLIDKKGIEYNFERFESANNMTGTGGNSFSYSFKINNIKFPDGSVMQFYYKIKTYHYLSNYEFSVDIQLHDATGYNGEIPRQMKKTPMLTQATEHLIDKIEYQNTLIQFKYLEDGQGNMINREDVNGGARLQKIEINFKPQQGAPQLKKEYLINTSYFISDLPQSSLNLFNSSQYPLSLLSKRLRLDSVEELLSQSKYSFEYEDSISLPHRFSYNTDYWGAFNGLENTSPIETFIFTPRHTTRMEAVFGGNKEPDIRFAKMGSLKKVKLPTGGTQEFEYELDEYYNEDQIVPIVSYNRREFMEEDDRFSTNPNFYEDIPIVMPAPDYRQGIDYKIQVASNACIDRPDPHDMPLGMFYYVVLVKGEEELPTRYFAGTNEYYDLPQLEAGITYKLRIKVGIMGSGNCTQPNIVHIRPKLVWAQKEETLLQNRKTGSLRTKSITLNDSDGMPQIKKSYQYKDFEDSAKLKSGGIYTGRSFNLISTSSIDCTIDEGCTNRKYCGIKTLYRSPTYLNLNSVFGKSVYYHNVTETFENLKNSNESFRKETAFSIPSREGYPTDEHYFDLLTYWPHQEYEGGKILNEKLYDSSGNKVKIISNVYDKDYHFNAQSSDNNNVNFALAFGIGVKGYPSACSSSGSHCFYNFAFDKNHYYITSAWVKHLSTTEENYKNGTLWMTNTTNYNYNPTYSHLNPVSVTQTNSLGQEVKTEYEYNHPYKKDEPTTVRTYENGAATSVQQTTFQAAGLPQYVFAKRGASTLDNVPPSEDLKVTYDRYDDNDNLEQYTLENGTPVSIIWGYNKQYPIAKIEGIVYTSIPAGHITDLVNASNADVNASTENTLRTELQELRQDNVLGGLMITTYTYDPLMGVTSITTPSGQTEYYIYDTAGRLQKVVDHEQKEVRKIDYHYQD